MTKKKALHGTVLSAIAVLGVGLLSLVTSPPAFRNHGIIQDGLSINGAEIPVTVTVKLWGPDGALKETRQSHNRITQVGMVNGLNRMLTTGSLISNYVGLDTGTGGTGTCPSTNFTDTALTTEAGTRQQDTTLTINSPTSSQRQGELIVTFAAANPNVTNSAICGIGLFSAVTGPDMFLRTTFSIVNKGIGDALTVTVRVNLTAS